VFSLTGMGVTWILDLFGVYLGGSAGLVWILRWFSFLIVRLCHSRHNSIHILFAAWWGTDVHRYYQMRMQMTHLHTESKISPRKEKHIEVMVLDLLLFVLMVSTSLR